jgi:hypothetical protein
VPGILSSRRLQQVLDPLLRKYHVNVLLSGHDHHYERTYPVYGGGRTSRARGELSNPYIAAVPYGEGESSSQQQLDAIRIIVGTGGRRIRNRCKYEVRRLLTGFACIDSRPFVFWYV